MSPTPVSSDDPPDTLLVREGLYARINKGLTMLADSLKLNSAQNFGSTSVILEDTCVHLLNLVYGLDLTNLNAEGANAPAADLIFRAGRVAYQITINDTTEKIRETHRKATEHDLALLVDSLTIFFFTLKGPNPPAASGKFTPCTSPTIKTLDLTGLMTDIRSLTVPQIEAVVALLEEELSLDFPRDYSRYPLRRNLPATSLGDGFIGRESFLQSLFEDLPQRRVYRVRGRQVIRGMGGVGKTRAAVEYALAYSSHYTALLFISADTPETLSSHLAALWQTLELPLTGEATTNTTLQEQAVLNWLQTNTGWLLIIDNADTPEARKAVQKLSIHLEFGHLIVTSRLTTWSIEFSMRPLGVLNQNQSTALLLRHTKGLRLIDPVHDDAAVESLAEELGGLALALEQAAAYIREEEITFQQYLERWQQSRLKLMAQYSDQGADDYHRHYPDIDRSLFVTYQTSVEQLPQPAQQLLQVLSWLAPDPFPTKHLATLEEIPDAAAHLTRLTKFSLATRTPDGEHCSVHRVLQDITRLRQTKTPPPMLSVALKWIDDAFLGDPGDVRTWPFLVPLLPHAIICSTHGKEHGIADPTSRLLSEVAQLLYSQAQHRRAEPLYLHALDLDEKRLGKNHPHVAIHLNNLAALLQSTNRLDQAEPLLRRALSIHEAILGPNHPDVAIDLNNLAQLLQATNHLNEAETLMLRALDIVEMAFGANHPDVAIRLNNLAILFQYTNRMEQVEPLMRRALSIDESSFGEGHPNVARSLNNLAGLLQATNRLAEAEPLMLRGLAIAEDSLGPDHPNVASHLNNYAMLLKETNRITEAEPLMHRALAIDEASFGPDHPHVARCLNNLGQLFHSTNRLKEAEPLMRRALAIDESSFGAEHPHVARDLNNLAMLLRDTDRLAEAEPLIRRALAIVEQSFGTEHPNSKLARENLAVLHEEMGK